MLLPFFSMHPHSQQVPGESQPCSGLQVPIHAPDSCSLFPKELTAGKEEQRGGATPALAKAREWRGWGCPPRGCDLEVPRQGFLQHPFFWAPPLVLAGVPTSLTPQIRQMEMFGVAQMSVPRLPHI